MREEPARYGICMFGQGGYTRVRPCWRYTNKDVANLIDFSTNDRDCFWIRNEKPIGSSGLRSMSKRVTNRDL